MTTESLTQTAEKMDAAILKAQPDSIAQLDSLISPLLLIGMRYKAKPVYYYGYKQGVVVCLYFKGKQKQVTPRGEAYGIFS